MHWKVKMCGVFAMFSASNSTVWRENAAVDSLEKIYTEGYFTV